MTKFYFELCFAPSIMMYTMEKQGMDHSAVTDAYL